MRELRGRWRWSVAVLLAAVLGAAPGAGPDPNDYILHYLDQTIDWERGITSLDRAPISTQDVVFRETVHQTSRQALQIGFQAARAQAAALAGTAKPASSQPAQTKPGAAGKVDRAKTIQTAAAAADQLVNQLNQQMAQVDKDIAGASGDALAGLQSKRDKLTSQMNFAKARQEALAKLMWFMASQDSGGAAGLVPRIDELEKTVPDAHPNSDEVATEKTVAAADAAKTQQQEFRENEAGILGLIGELFNLTYRMSDLSNLTAQTSVLIDWNEKLRAPIRAELQAAVRQGETLSQSSDTNDPAKLDAQRAQIDALSARFKQLIEVAVPLSNQSVLLESTERSLTDWRASLRKAYWRLLRALGIRAAVVAGLIFLMLGISKIWGKLALRYVTDARRRRQFFLIRRIVVGSVIVVILVASIVAEFGSLATFAGLITAGIAVSLQTVILSGVAHFFFIGRYGVRVGDRVTIANVTGDVVDIGLFRLYLMELKGNARDLRPTGRVVVFSNSVLFQPSAFYKQFPGVNYTWHEVALTLAPDTDHHLAEERLMGAVDAVYEKYKEDIERQYASLSPTLHVGILPPKLEGRLRLVDAGLEYVIRYPVDNQKAADIDDQITRKLLETIENEPRLKMVPSGTPEIQSADPVPKPEPAKPAAA
ncbi:MAG TPA: mechanosensitive ion channel family protein [Tepidisphaeraceae bacterium]